MFVGRNEKKVLQNALTKKRSAVLVYGKRKVGKTTLIRNVLDEGNKTYRELMLKLFPVFLWR